jgi:hypothetical protein
MCVAGSFTKTEWFLEWILERVVPHVTSAQTKNDSQKSDFGIYNLSPYQAVS